MKMKVKDLRDYLNLHDISTETCREKEELVFLVLGQQPVVSQEGRTRAPAFSSGFPEQQAFLSRPRSSTVPPTLPGPTPATQATAAPAAQAQENRQVRRSCSLCQFEAHFLPARVVGLGCELPCRTYVHR